MYLCHMNTEDIKQYDNTFKFRCDKYRCDYKNISNIEIIDEHFFSSRSEKSIIARALKTNSSSPKNKYFCISSTTQSIVRKYITFASFVCDYTHNLDFSIPHSTVIYRHIPCVIVRELYVS